MCRVHVDGGGAAEDVAGLGLVALFNEAKAGLDMPKALDAVRGALSNLAHPSWQEETGVTDHVRPRTGDATPPLRWDWQIRHPFLPPMSVGAECRDPRHCRVWTSCALNSMVGVM